MSEGARLEGLRVVVDTNVLVASVLNPDRTPAQALGLLLARGDTLLVDPRMLLEYNDVLRRPKFKKVSPERITLLLESVARVSEPVTVIEPFAGALLDDDDRVFIEVALAGRADLILTGNGKHFAPTLPVRVMNPAALVALLLG